MPIKCFIAVLFCILATTVSHINAFAHNFISLIAPSTLEQGQLVSNIEHRFLGPVDEHALNTLFGSDSGSNIALSARYRAFSNIEFSFSRASLNKEHDIGVSFVLPEWSGLRSQIEGHAVFYKPQTSNSYIKNGVFVTAIQPPRYGPFTIIGNLIYDGFYKQTGLGIGLEWAYHDTYHFFGELYTNHKKEGQNAVYITGIKWNTFGHRFLFFLSNNTYNGIRHMIAGTQRNDMHLGFSFLRIFDL